MSKCKHKNWKNVSVKEAVVCENCGETIGHMTKTYGEGVENKTTESWEREFDEEFGEEAQSTGQLDLHDFYQYLYGDIKSFISNLLSKQENKIRQIVKRNSDDEWNNVNYEQNGTIVTQTRGTYRDEYGNYHFPGERIWKENKLGD